MSKEARTLVVKLLSDRRRFFDKNNVLNSDGRRLLSKVIKLVLRDRPELRDFLSKVRRDPTLDNVMRLAEE
ncbi:MAG: hypothetical protein QXP80_07310, partial [Zestosphaera sp.]